MLLACRDVDPFVFDDALGPYPGSFLARIPIPNPIPVAYSCLNSDPLTSTLTIELVGKNTLDQAAKQGMAGMLSHHDEMAESRNMPLVVRISLRVAPFNSYFNSFSRCRRDESYHDCDER